MRILELLYGKKIKIVSAYALHAYARHEQDFVFPGELEDTEIRKILWNRSDGRLKQFSVICIHKRRSKTLLCEIDKYRPITEAKLTEWYDD